MHAVGAGVPVEPLALRALLERSAHAMPPQEAVDVHPSRSAATVAWSHELAALSREAVAAGSLRLRHQRECGEWARASES